MPEWLVSWMGAEDVRLWNAADLRGLNAPPDMDGRPYPRALAWALPVNPRIMDKVSQGPNQAYAQEYARLNRRLDAIGHELAAAIVARGHRALALAASERTDPDFIRGDFPHKTAATRAGLGWIGRHCQLITRPFGSWVRLGTVFTDMPLPCGRPIERGYCGRCHRCVDACPAKALKGCSWSVGTPREDLLDARRCDRWKKTHYRQFHNGHNCGICSAVCPYGRKTLHRPGSD